MGIQTFFKKKGYLDAKIVNERIGLLNLVYTIQAGNKLFFYKKPDNTSPLSQNLDPKRSFNEWQGIQLASTVVSNVPNIFHFDPDNLIMITTAPKIKSSLLRLQLLEGELRINKIKQLAQDIKKVHSIKFDSSNPRHAALDPKYFYQLNTKVFYHALQDEYPEAMEALIKNVNTPSCLVHADFNPKNIVTYEDKFVIIDWEKSFFSSPEVDLGNMLAHFVIKGLHLNRQDFLDLPRVFLEEYGDGYDADMVKGHMGVNIWSRVGSIAKARYLTPEGQAKVWDMARKYLTEFTEVIKQRKLVNTPS